MADDSMGKFDFLLGVWEMKFRVPKSHFSDKDEGNGEGKFKRFLNDKYVTFDYSAEFSASQASAHGVFSWDVKSKIYRYWWFEDSGSFTEATCNFIDDKTLSFNWHNSLLVQTFNLLDDGRILLEMRYPVSKDDYQIVLEVTFTRK